MPLRLRNIKQNLANISWNTIFEWIRRIGIRLISVESLVAIISLQFTVLVFFELHHTDSVYDRILQHLLTVNGIFSAILVTYLFSRVTWTKDRKLELYRESIGISQKITDFRRVLYTLTRYYNVWIDDDRHSKRLLETKKYRNIDFHDFHLSLTSDYTAPNAALIQELFEENEYSEGISSVYLAMISMVDDRRSDRLQFNEEIYTDYNYQETYDYSIIERWLRCGETDTIGYWFDRPNQFLNFTAFSQNDREAILAATTRINSKFEGSELNNSLIKDLAYEMSFHIKELYGILNSLKKGFQRLDSLIIVLITLSLLIGVLLPLSLLIFQSWQNPILERIGISVNLGLILFFALRLPSSILKEMKFIK